MDLSIEDNFKEIENLNRNVLHIIEQMKRNSDTSKRVALVAESLKLIKEFTDLLVVNEFKINQLIEPSIDQLYELDKFKSILPNLKLHLRTSQLESKKQEELFAEQQKVEYLKNIYIVAEEEGDIDVQRNKLFEYKDGKYAPSKAQNYLDKNKQVTSKYLKTRQLLETSAFQTDLTLENFENSSRNLQNMNDSYDLMNDFLDAGRALVRSLNQLGAKQRTQVKYALYFFVGCCVFVIFRRTFGMALKIYWLLSLPIRIVLLPFRIVFSVLKMLIGSNAGIERAEDILGITEDLLITTATSLSDMIATTSTSAVSSLTSSSTFIEGYEELSRKLSAIIDEDAESSTILTTIVSTPTDRLIDEL